MAATRYRGSWRDALLAGRSSPVSLSLQPPTAAAVVAQPDDVAAWLGTWRSFAVTDHRSAVLRTTVLRTSHGDQPVYTHLDLADQDALADLNPDSREHWQRVTVRWTRLKSAVTDPVMIKPWLTQIMELPDADFELLRAAATWFDENPRSGLTIRRVPVPGMHTKWLVRHRRLVLAVLGRARSAAELSAGELPADDVHDVEEVPEDDLDILGLRPVPREADIRLADPADRRAFHGLEHLRAPVDELAHLPLTPRTVLVVENKEAALAVADADSLVIIHSLGNHVGVLAELPWIPATRTFYWGDLDRHGYTLLSRARAAVGGLQSLLMSVGDVDTYRHLAVNENLDRYDPPEQTLTPDETAGMQALAQADGYLRIEQERLPADALEAVFVAVTSGS